MSIPRVALTAHDRPASAEERDAHGAELFRRLAETDSSSTREQLRSELACLYLDLADALARRYCGRGESDEELKQAAYVGLMKAIRGFSPGRGTPFVGYAVPTITGELKRH